jgi:hypothetical protein
MAMHWRLCLENGAEEIHGSPSDGGEVAEVIEASKETSLHHVVEIFTGIHLVTHDRGEENADRDQD